MKKLAILLTVSIILCTFFPETIFSEPEYNKKLENAISKSKQLFNITDDYDIFDSSVSSYDSGTVFYLSWNDSKGKLGGISVSLYSNGNIISYNKYKAYYEKESKLPSITKEEGLDLAIENIKKISPNLADNLKYKETNEPINPKSQEYNYEFLRTVNKVPYLDNNLIVSIDKTSGELLSYNLNWDYNLAFPDKNGIMSLNKAKSLYKEKIGLDLVYKKDYTTEEPSLYLVYTSLYGNKGIKAKDGSLFNYKRKTVDDFDKGEEHIGIDEKKTISSISNLLSEKQAVESARKELNIDNSYIAKDINLYSYWKNKGKYAWTMNLSKKDENDLIYNYNVSIDASTGDLISFSYDAPFVEASEIKYDWESALTIAKEYIEKRDPDKIEEIELFDDSSDELANEEQYCFNFIRKHNGAYVAGDSITIDVDGRNGQVVGYNIEWYNGKFPDTPINIQLEDAYNIMSEEIGFRLEYIKEDKEDSEKIVLGYLPSPNKPLIISAETGEILDSSGKQFKENTVQRYKDIDDSYAKDKIEILAEHGVVIPSNRFKPKEKITQSEFLSLLIKANIPNFNLDDERSIDNLYNYLINIKVISEDEKAPDKKITREEGVKYIINLMRYDKLAKANYLYKDIFKDSSDIDPELKGYISVAHGLNIIEGYNGYIRPKEELSRQDAAIMIYNYLFNE